MMWFIVGVIVGIAIAFAYWMYIMINWFDR